MIQTEPNLVQTKSFFMKRASIITHIEKSFINFFINKHYFIKNIYQLNCLKNSIQFLAFINPA